MPDPVLYLLIAWLAMAVVMFVLWLVQKAKNDAGIVDVGWAFGMAATAIFLAIMAPTDPLRRIIVGGLAAVWGIRLGWHLLTDRFLRPGEDSRYKYWREKAGAKANKVFFVFFQVQAFWTILFSVPFAVALWNPAGIGNVWFAAGVLIWIIAVTGESIADAQLKAFKARPDSRGRTCREGLWKYSRHPNYFFEWIHWFAYVAFSISYGYGWISLLGPLVMFLFLWKITGIPWVEQRALQSRGDDYRHYQKTTSVFIPWPPKESTR